MKGFLLRWLLDPAAIRKSRTLTATIHRPGCRRTDDPLEQAQDGLPASNGPSGALSIRGAIRFDVRAGMHVGFTVS
jgi:hypothetical protein